MQRKAEKRTERKYSQEGGKNDEKDRKKEKTGEKRRTEKEKQDKKTKKEREKIEKVKWKGESKNVTQKLYPAILLSS